MTSPRHWLISPKTGRIVCHKCKRGYGSERDGLCSNCRGMTADQAFGKADLRHLNKRRPT